MSRSGVISNINQALPTNGNDEISASDLRGVLINDIANEFMNLEDDAEIPVYNSSKSYKTGKLVLNQGVIWRAIVNVLATQAPPTLPTASNSFWQIQGLNIPFDYANLLNKPNLSLKADLVGGLVPTSQLPSFVDDVLEFANLASFPVTGETGKIYVAIDTNRSYRWSGSSYILIISLDECLQTDIQNEATTSSNFYVSPRRFWQGITKSLALAWTWTLKQTFSIGVNLGNNASPSANGDLWSDGTSILTRLGGIIRTLLTSANGRYGRTIFVSKDGNNTTAQVGSSLFPYLTIQGAVNASSTGDTICIYNGTYTENLSWVSLSNVKFIMYDAIIIGNHIATSAVNLTIEMLGDSEFRSNTTSAIIAHTNGSIKIKGGQFVINHTGATFTINNTNSDSYIRGTRFVTTVASPAIAFNLCGWSVFDCKFRSTSTAPALQLGQTSTNFYNSFMVNTGASGRAVDANQSTNVTFHNCYIRSQNGDAIGSGLSWKINLVGGYVISYNSSTLTSLGYAINANSNAISNISANGTFFYGVNTVYRGLTSPSRASILDFTNCKMVCTSGEILVDNPSLLGTYCLLRNTDISKALTIGQSGDATVIQSNVYPNTNIILPDLTFTC